VKAIMIVVTTIATSADAKIIDSAFNHHQHSLTLLCAVMR
jgi:hypothetical protein